MIAKLTYSLKLYFLNRLTFWHHCFFLKVLIPDHLPTGCDTVFKTGLSASEFSVTTDYFKLNPMVKEFDLSLNITRCVTNGRKKACSSGISTMTIFVNDPPYKGIDKILSSMSSKPIDIRWIRTGSQSFWKIMYRIIYFRQFFIK